MSFEVDRRGFLIAGGLAAITGVAGCGSPDAAPTSTASLTPTGTATPLAQRWAALANQIDGKLALPSGAAYGQVRLTENPRYDGAHPRAVLSAASPKDVSVGFKFAQDNHIPVALRSGGHSYTGWSSGGGGDSGNPSALVIDCRPMSQVQINGTSATVAAGAALAHVYDQLGNAGRAIPGGSCATVGVAGLTLGGGVGVLTRAYGLTCDSVTSMQVVTADGSIVTASANEHPDLYWGLRGGGGGRLGMVTSFQFATVQAPTITSFYFQWSVSAAQQVIPAWQDWINNASNQVWSTLKVLGAGAHPGGPVVIVAGTYVGSGSFDSVLSGFLSSVPTPGSRGVHTKSYRDTMFAYAGCSDIPANHCMTGPGGSLQREAFAAVSHVGYDPIDSAGISVITDHVSHPPRYLKEAGLSIDALGGQVATVDPSATAFVHRKALVTVQYTATFVSVNTPNALVVADLAPVAAKFVHDFRAAMVPTWGDHAYVNYVDPTLIDYKTAYFGANAPRLAQVAQTYDPHHFFSQPQAY